MRMSDRLLAEFPPTTTAEWEAAIAKDLKGADYDKKLLWRTAEGMAVRPYYRAEDLADMDWLQASPGSFPYVRGTRAEGGWRIRESIDLRDAASANLAARAAVAAGAEEISFDRVALASKSDFALLLSGLDDVPVHLGIVDEPWIQPLLSHLRKAARGAEISLGLDPLNDLALAVRVAPFAPATLVPFTLDAARFEEGGGSAVDEIGFALGAGVDYLAAMQERGVDPERAAALVEFNFAIGRNFFMQMGKFRAFRMLWARTVESFGGSPESGRARIAARTSRWNKTVYDAQVNVLRATTEAMSAVLGGVDSISIAPFDECFAQPDEGSRRLARNTQLMLKREAMMARVADPGGGSYALEAITAFLARAGWKRLQEVEERGGYRKAAEWVEQELVKGLAGRERAVAQRRRVFVGTNQFANAAEKALHRVDPGRMGLHTRGTRAYEELRLRTERSGKMPRILLAEMGDAKMRAARAAFAASFFACAGWEVIARRFSSVDEILTNEADAIVLCSSDPEYAALVGELLPKLKAAGCATPVIVAGNPENTGELVAAGVADFIHVRSNPLEVLAAWQQRLGIKD